MPIKMTVGDIEARVQAIRDMAGDDEAAHSAEDALHHDVLVTIAYGAENAARLALTALRTLDIEFSRWCA